MDLLIQIIFILMVMVSSALCVLALLYISGELQ